MIRYALILTTILGSAALDEAPITGAVEQVAAAKPLGYTEFCLDHPKLCWTDTQEPRDLTSIEIDTAGAINAEVNRAIAYVPMPDLDPWHIFPAFGDCDDFAASKLSRLVEAGIPRINIRFALVRTETGGAHLVLLLNVGATELVMDNRSPRMSRAVDSPYQFVAVERLWGDGYAHWAVPEGLPR